MNKNFLISDKNNNTNNIENLDLDFDKFKCIKYKKCSSKTTQGNKYVNGKNIYGFGYLFETLKNLVHNEKNNSEIKIGNNNYKRTFFFSIHGPKSCGKTTFVKNFCKIFSIDILIINMQFVDSISKDMYFLPNLKQFLSDKKNKLYLVFQTCDNLFESNFVEFKTSIYQFFEFLKKQKNFVIFFNCVMSLEDLTNSEHVNMNMIGFIENPFFYQRIPTTEKTKIIKKFFKNILQEVCANEVYLHNYNNNDNDSDKDNDNNSVNGNDNDNTEEEYSILLKKFEKILEEEKQAESEGNKRKKKQKLNSKNKKIKTKKSESDYNPESFTFIPKEKSKSNIKINEILKNKISKSEKLITISENDEFEYTYCDVICDQIITKILLFTNYYLYIQLIEIFEDYLYYCSMNFNEIIHDNNNNIYDYHNGNGNDNRSITIIKNKVSYYYYILDQKIFFDYIKSKFNQLTLIQQINHLHYNKDSQSVIESYRCIINVENELVINDTLSFDLNIQIIQSWDDCISLICICGEHILNEKIYIPKINVNSSIIKKKIQVSTFKLSKGSYATLWGVFKNNILLESFFVNFEVF